MSARPRETVAPGALAARAVQEVIGAGRNAEDALLQVAAPMADRSAVRAILAGTLRWYLRLAPVVDALLTPAQRMQTQLHALLVTAVHQLEYSRAVPAVVVNIAVDAARVLGHSSASGFVNALLRRYLRERAALLQRIDRSEAAVSAHPRWLLREIVAGAGAAAPQVIAANNDAPPMTLRVNLARTTRDAAQQLLANQGIESAPGLMPTTLVLDQAVDVDSLPGFAAGLLSVQDAGAQHAAVLLDARAGERILDACAAPGGKTGHILERTPAVAQLIALDISPARLARVASNLERLGLVAKLVAGDLLAPQWWDGQPFDRILLDAPCSGTGVIRRHPDIKLLRRPGDATGFAATQQQLLAAGAAMLKPGGLLVYATCSMLATENQQVIGEFLRTRPGWLRARDDLQLWPTPRAAGAAAVTDGFYYACLRAAGES